jgi:hypothetical protein
MTSWGIVQAGLAMAPDRKIVITAEGPTGLRITLMDPVRPARHEDISTDEDPSKAALRLLQDV